MKASICLSTYNKAGYLEKTLASIFSQNPPFEFEVIVTDDGSTDGTMGVCYDFPVQYHHLARPGYCNPAGARNVAYRAARGEIIIAQSDDVIHRTSDCIERLVAELRRRRFLIGTVTNVDRQGKPYSDPEGKGWGDRVKVYTSPKVRRPLFFLGSLWREDLYAIGGEDGEFTKPGYDDDWFAACLVRGRGLIPEYSRFVVGHHQHHPHTEQWDAIEESGKLYKRKVAEAAKSGVWCSSGGPWEFVA